MLSAPPFPASDFRLPLPSLLIRLATPPRQQVNFHAPLARPGIRLGGSPRAGERSGTRTMVTRSALPTPCFPQHRHCAPPGRRVRSGKRGTGTGSLAAPRGKRLERRAGADPRTARPHRLPPSSEPRSPGSCAGPGKKPRGPRAPGPEADPQAAPWWRLQLRPPAPP